jgi:hypothetical protein
MTTREITDEDIKYFHERLILVVPPFYKKCLDEFNNPKPKPKRLRDRRKKVKQ